jgi:hypothetical protein
MRARAGGGGRSSMSAGRMLRLTSPGCRRRPAGLIGCPRKRNGNMYVGPARRHAIRSATQSRPTTPTTVIRNWSALARSAPTRRTPGVSMTCMAMSGSGSTMTGTKTTGMRRATGQPGSIRERARSRAFACCAAGPGANFRGGPGPPAAVGAAQAAGTTMSGSGWPEHFLNSRPLTSLLLGSGRSPGRCVGGKEVMTEATKQSGIALG